MALSQTEGDFLTLHELVRAARNKLDRNIWDYLIGGTATETTLLRNRHALDRLALRPRVLRDVSKADLVGIGRVYCYGLVAAGSDGIIRVLDLLEAEIVECLGLLGITKISELNRSHVCKGEPVYPPHVHSAFPLMQLPPENY
jgi:isopentenyl diphosphate isomerase/L-lactate dehydrogenase-like FMN-dependent dehydrogenase